MNTWIIIIGMAVLLLLSVTVFANPFALRLSELQESYIQNLHPSVQNKFRRFIAAIERKGWSVEIASCHRGWDKSLYIWQTNPKVQACCQPGYDYHYFGFACDLVLRGPNGERLGNSSPREAWESTGIRKLAERYGLRWGIDFNNYYDPVHFDFPKYQINSLVEKAVQTCGSLQGDCGNTINLSGVQKRQA